MNRKKIVIGLSVLISLIVMLGITTGTIIPKDDWDFKDYYNIFNANNITAKNITANYFFGNGSQLTDISQAESDPFWSDNFTKYNSSWTSTYNASYVPYNYSNKNVILSNNYNFTIGDDFFVNSNLGRVGINTSSPEANLDVRGGAIFRNGNVDIKGNYVAGASGYYLRFYDQDNSDYAYLRQDDTEFKITAPYFSFLASVGYANYQAVGAQSFKSTSSDVAFSASRDILFRDYPAEDTKMIIKTATGKVGIGTITPTEKLEVNGSLFLTKDSDKIYLGASKDISHFFDGTSYNITAEVGSPNFNFDTSGSFNFLNGKVGIGTSSPDAFLDVTSPSGNNVPAVFHSGHATTGYITFADVSTTDIYKVRVGSVGDELSLFAGGSESLRIDSSGNVGIGTTTPQNELNVIGDGNFTGNLYMNENLVLTSYTESDPLAYNGTLAYNSSLATYDTWAYNQTIPANAYSDDLNSSQATWVDNLFVRFTELVSQVGNWTLDKVDYSTTSTIIGWGYYNSTDFSISNYRLKVNNTFYGNVGIGTDSPQRKLSLSSSNILHEGSVFGLYNTYSNTGNRNWAIGTSIVDYGDFHIMVSSAEGGAPTVSKFVMDRVGKVGIGTSIPQNTLNVVGDGNFTGNLYMNENLVLTSYTETDPLWTGNWTNVAFTNIDETFDENVSFVKNISVDGTAITDNYKYQSSKTFYFPINPADFTTSDPDVDDVVNIGNHIEATENGVTFVSPVYIPNGATITSTVLYGSAGTTGEIWNLVRTNVSSTGTQIIAYSNFGIVNTTLSYTTIDNSVYSYYLQTTSLDIGDRIYGGMIEYTLDEVSH